MTRIWAITILALTASFTLAQDDGVKIKDKEKVAAKDKIKLKDKDFRVEGKFTDNDPKDKERMGPAQTHTVKMKAGQTYTIDMVSSDVDSYLRLLDPKGKQLDEDDDSGGMLNSRIIFNCGKDGDYKIVCTTFAADMTGNYVLTVKNSANNYQPTTSHTQMVGKEAPDFKGDFAVNGKPTKLSDLKGKVVLLSFGEVRSTPAANTLPALAELHKAFKADGLAVVGVTYYNTDYGQRLAFDKETGKLTDLKEADHQSDQTMLSNYAAYHKVEHLLMALAKQEALDAFNAYAVNSLPQIVLIDRQGMVRFIHIGEVKGASDAETAIKNEIKKLVAEK